MDAINSYEDLIAWQKAYQLVLKVYEITRSFPADERFGLTQQMRRAAVSVPSNIAEGWGRGSRKDYIRFLNMARGSVYELLTQTRLVLDLNYLNDNKSAYEDMKEVERILNGLIRSLETA